MQTSNTIEFKLLNFIRSDKLITRLRWSRGSVLAGSKPAEAVGFLGRKIPQHAFLRRGSKAAGPMS